MKRFLLPLVFLPLATDRPAVEETLRFRLEEGTELVRTFEANAESELQSMTRSLDGETFEEVDDLSMTIVSLERVVVRDEIVEVEDGRPTDFRREYVELLQESTRSDGENEVDSTSGCDLEGITVRFLWDDADEAFYAELDDDSDDVEDDTLEWLRADMDLYGMLPEGDVEEGDSWDIDAEPYLPLMWPGGIVDYYDDEEVGYDAFEQKLNRALVENLEGEGTVTYEGTRDEDGVLVAVLALELSVESSVELEREIELVEFDEDGRVGRPNGARDSIDVTVEVTIEREIEGELLWDLEAGHLHSARFEADGEWERTESRTVEHEGTEYELAQTLTFAGNVEYTVAVERE